MARTPEVESLQRKLNAFTKKYLRGVKPLAVDGEKGPGTNTRVESVKFYLGFGKTREANSTTLSDLFLRALADPKGRWLGARALATGAARRTRQRARARPRGRLSSTLWGGCRSVTNEVIRIVGGRATVSSRKRTATFGNPGSDHHVSQVHADAVDFRIANAHGLADEISRRLGGPSNIRDYQNFYITRAGKRFRVQIIAGTHGTGPHLHVGVRRA